MSRLRKRVRATTLREVVEWPLCEKLLSPATRKYWHGRGRPGNREGTDQCGCFASYKIGGKFYCGKHAGIVALELLVANGGIEPLS